jgi:hypothetical protein
MDGTNLQHIEVQGVNIIRYSNLTNRSQYFQVFFQVSNMAPISCTVDILTMLYFAPYVVQEIDIYNSCGVLSVLSQGFEGPLECVSCALCLLEILKT